MNMNRNEVYWHIINVNKCVYKTPAKFTNSRKGEFDPHPHKS